MNKTTGNVIEKEMKEQRCKRQAVADIYVKFYNQDIKF